MVIDGPIMRKVPRKVAGLAAVVVTMLLAATSAQAYQAAAGWIASDYVTGFSYRPGAAGPVGLAFDGSGNLLVANSYAAALHKVAPGGGTADGTKIRGGYGGATGPRIRQERPPVHGPWSAA